MKAVRRSAFPVICAIVLGAALAACSSAPRRPAEPAKAPPAAAPAKPAPAGAAAPAPAGKYRDQAEIRAPISKDELALVSSANQLVGMAPDAAVVVNGKQFKLDCIGTVCAIYYRLGIDLTKDFGKYPGNGVSRLYQSLLARGVIHYDRYPRVGDVIFWDNTWDANGDGDRTNDPRTHAGVVLAVDSDGTIDYVHENMFKGVIVEKMNLLNPAAAQDATGKRINSSLAIATVSGGPKPAKFLAGDVFQAFGDALKIRKDFEVAAAPGAELLASR